MRAHEIFQKLDDDHCVEILNTLREVEPEGFKGIQASLATQRRLRLVFVQRKSRAEQALWMLKSLRTPSLDQLAEHFLQIYLLKAKTSLVTDFLDGVGIEHDGEGSVEDLPDALDAAKLKATTENLLKGHPQDDVAIYLNVFQMQTEKGWPELANLIDKDPRLQVGGAPPAAAAEEEE